MNIQDVSTRTDVPTTWLEIVAALFAGQERLMEKYREIERLPAPPLSVHLASGQRVLKDFAWRTVEELAEAFESIVKHHDDRETAREHCLEELADAFHFYIELLIFAGIGPQQAAGNRTLVSSNHPSIFDDAWSKAGGPLQPFYWDAAYHIGIAMNFLRNKPWKQSQVPTDEARLREALLRGWHALVSLWAIHGMTDAELFQFYFRKHAVNEFRQRSQY